MVEQIWIFIILLLLISRKGGDNDETFFSKLLRDNLVQNTGHNVI